MIEYKTMGWLQLIGAVVAGFFGYQDSNWGVLTLAIVLLLTSIHHLTTKKKH
ncbi:hypothetical protein ACFLZZ_00780 [Nanoarchaeota archaeon]